VRKDPARLGLPEDDLVADLYRRTVELSNEVFQVLV
jgi:hypothetical protein